MRPLYREELIGANLPGRIIYKGVGTGSPIESDKMNVGFGVCNDTTGYMAPHKHDEETVYIVSCEKAYACYSGEPDALKYETALKKGMLLHFEKDEWHRFRCDEGGSLEFMFIYGHTDDVRPEDRKK